MRQIGRGPLVLLMLAVAFVARPAPVAAQEGAAAHWEGAIQTPGTALQVTVDLAMQDGAWKGAIDIPAQGATDLRLTGIAVRADSVRFSIQGVPGNPTFAGALSDDGAVLSGDFTQGGQTFPFRLERKGAPELAPPGPSPAEALQGFDDFVRARMDDWSVPGVAMAIVKDDSVILMKGYGYRDVADRKPVTSQTLFAIGSATKAFTATVVATLVDDGKLDWDEPVRTYLPWFELEDEFATQRMTPTDLLTHDSGLPRHDLVWYGSDASREQLVRRLRYLQPSADFRSRFQYQNLMVMTAGYLAGQVAGTTWEDLVRTRIFQPLGMTHSDLSVEALQQAPDYAFGYRKKEAAESEKKAATDGQEPDIADRVVRMPFRKIDNIGPAGSINSNVADMVQWLKLHMGDGTVDGTRIVSTTNLQKLHTAKMVVTGGPLATLFRQPEMPYLMYALGWFVQPYRGHEMLQHGGNIDGFSALVSFLPRDRMGLVILTNMNGTALPMVLALGAYDRLLGLDPIDWSARYKAIQQRLESSQEAGKKREDIDRKKDTHPSHPLQDYAGTYTNPAYGALQVDIDGGELRASLHGLASGLEHWHYDVFRATQDALEGTKLVFRTNLRGDIDRVQVALQPDVDPIEFVRQPPDSMSDPKFLKQFVGDYDVMGATATVALRGKTLSVTIPGQPTYELEPYRGTEFDLKGLKGYSVRFTMQDGAVKEMIFIQPNGVFTADRKTPEKAIK